MGLRVRAERQLTHLLLKICPERRQRRGCGLRNRKTAQSESGVEQTAEYEQAGVQRNEV